MTISILEFGTGYGITSNIGTYRWNGHSFNPTGDKSDGYQTWNPWTESWEGATLLFPVTGFNLGSMQQGNEAVLTLIKFSTNINDSGVVTLVYKDPQGNILFTFTYPWSTSAGYWLAVWSGIGIKGNDHNEIHENGVYTVNYTITYNGGGSQITGSSSFTIYDYPVPTGVVWWSPAVGSLWVQSDRLCFICGDGFVIRCRHDGIDYGNVGVQYAGHIWVTGARIGYVDQLGHLRRTKMGDRYGWTGYDDELPRSCGRANMGHIWLSNGFNSYFLMIVGANGLKYRIGAGYSDTGDYQ